MQKYIHDMPHKEVLYEDQIFISMQFNILYKNRAHYIAITPNLTRRLAYRRPTMIRRLMHTITQEL
jgi:hypothetical protein